MKFTNRGLTLIPLLSLLALFSACGGKGSTGGSPAAPSAADLARRLPDSAFKVEWTPPSVPATIAPGQTLKLTVGVKNTGDQVWPDKKLADLGRKPGGAYAVRLSYRFKRPDGQLVQDYRIRVELPEPLAPGKSVSLPIEVQAPAGSGDYLLQFDVVQELYRWFADKGAAQLVIPLKVG